MVSSMHRLLLRERRNNRSNSDFQTFFEGFSNMPNFKGSTLTHLQVFQISMKFLLQVASDIRIL